jgi:hypothetical protein
VEALEAHLNQQLERSRDFFWNRIRWELICARIPPAAAELVDVGAGPGFLGDFLLEHRPQVDYRFVEPIENLERQLSDRFGPEANRRDADFGGARYVTLMDVLEHQADDRAFMAGLAAKMTRGTTMLLTVPAMPFLWSEWDAMLGHHRRYTKRALGEVVEALPFEVVEQSYLFPELIPFGLFRRLRLGRGNSMDAEQAGDAEFPELPRPVNGALYRIAGVTTALRRLWPAGTSLFAVLRRS